MQFLRLEAQGLTGVDVETITEVTAFRDGPHLWDWLVHSNPIVGEILSELDLGERETGAVRAALDGLVRDRAAADGSAALTAPVHIGTATRGHTFR